MIAIDVIDSIQSESLLSLNELKDALFSLNINKCFTDDDISFNVVKYCFGHLMHIFNLVLRKGIFPDDLKSSSYSNV